MDTRITPELIKTALRRSSLSALLDIQDLSHVGQGLTVRIEGTFDLHTMAAVLNGDLPPSRRRG